MKVRACVLLSPLFLLTLQKQIRQIRSFRRRCLKNFFPPVFYASGFFRLKSGLWRLSANKSTMSLCHLTSRKPGKFLIISGYLIQTVLCYAGVYKTLVKTSCDFLSWGKQKPLWWVTKCSYARKPVALWCNGSPDVDWMTDPSKRWENTDCISHIKTRSRRLHVE